jgi:fido (protein-threonine AMPylation protein)
VAGPAWDDEPTSPRLEENLERIRVGIIADSISSHVMPAVEQVIEWHRQMYEDIEIPDDAYRGAFRGSVHPALIDYEVTVGGFAVTRAADVPASVANLILALKERVDTLDTLDADTSAEILEPDFVEAVIDAAAWLHGEWVRIHPFANGNGRTGRMWVLWLCSRYGLPQILSLRPRPDMGYESTTMMSMIGDHRMFNQYLLVQYNQA